VSADESATVDAEMGAATVGAAAMGAATVGAAAMGAATVGAAAMGDATVGAAEAKAATGATTIPGCCAIRIGAFESVAGAVVCAIVGVINVGVLCFGAKLLVGACCVSGVTGIITTAHAFAPKYKIKMHK